MPAEPVERVQRVIDGDAQLVLDDRLAPILIVTWFGSASAKTVDTFHAWVDGQIARARARSEHLAVIIDSTEADRPTPAVRHKFTEHEFDSDVLIAVPTVITNPLIRGAMTAAGWVLGDRMRGVTSCSTLPDAFDRARTALREAGDRPPPPARINAYVRAQREPVPRADRRP